MRITLNKFYLSELERLKTIFSFTMWVVDYANLELFGDALRQQAKFDGTFPRPISFTPYTTNPTFKTIYTKDTVILKEYGALSIFPKIEYWELAGFKYKNGTLTHAKLDEELILGEECIYIYKQHDCSKTSKTQNWIDEKVRCGACHKEVESN